MTDTNTDPTDFGALFSQQLSGSNEEAVALQAELDKDAPSESEKPWWLVQPPVARGTSERFLNPGERSASQLRMVRDCALRYSWRYHDKRREPGNAAAYVGKLCHGALEDAAARRIDRKVRDQIPMKASTDELLHLLEFQPAQIHGEEWRPEELPNITLHDLEEARTILRKNGPVDFSATESAEAAFKLRIGSSLVIGGKIDRIDLYPRGVTNPSRVVIVDYKTNQQMLSEEEVQDAPQTGCYLMWARQRWPSCPLIVFEWRNIRRGESVYVRWTPELHESYLALARTANALIVQRDRTAKPSDKCRYCGFREGDRQHPPCEAFQAELRRADQRLKNPQGLAAQDLHQVMRVYRDSVVSAKLHTSRKEDAKKVILDKLGTRTSFRSFDLSANVQQDRPRRFHALYSMLVELSAVLELDPAQVISSLCSLKVSKLDDLIDSLELDKRLEAERVIERYKSYSLSKPKLTVRDVKPQLF